MEVYFKSIDGIWFGLACEGSRVFATAFGNDEKKVLLSMKDALKIESLQIAGVPSINAKNIFSAIKTVYDGKDLAEKILLDVERMPFYTKRVLKTVLQIPVGYVTSYGAVAEAAGGGARAVGNVMASNPFAPIVPCHRVVTSNLGLGGYSGGLRTKLELLKREKRGFTEKREVLVNCGVLKLFPVEFVFRKIEKTKA